MLLTLKAKTEKLFKGDTIYEHFILVMLLLIFSLKPKKRLAITFGLCISIGGGVSSGRVCYQQGEIFRRIKSVILVF